MVSSDAHLERQQNRGRTNQEMGENTEMNGWFRLKSAQRAMKWARVSFISSELTDFSQHKRIVA